MSDHLLECMTKKALINIIKEKEREIQILKAEGKKKTHRSDYTVNPFHDMFDTFGDK